MTSGWRGEPQRHALSAKGIKSKLFGLKRFKPNKSYDPDTGQHHMERNELTNKADDLNFLCGGRPYEDSDEYYNNQPNPELAQNVQQAKQDFYSMNIKDQQKLLPYLDENTIFELGLSSNDVHRIQSAKCER